MTGSHSDSLVFFGATGDLAYKKIFPALQAMSKRGSLGIPIVGVAKAGWNLDQLRARARESVEKHGGLDREERESMQNHATLGGELLEGAKSDLLKMAGIIASSHHERWDGRGYPQGLEAEAIPLPARVVAVADAFDALTHARPYKEAWPLAEALAEIQQERGWQFDPQVVDALLEIHRGGRHVVHVARQK